MEMRTYIVTTESGYRGAEISCFAVAVIEGAAALRWESG
jgi:hypothetical protein